jgi:hypothetical protein
MFEVSNTPHGVKVDVRGDLDGFGSAAFVARGMVVYAGALFVEAKPVLLAGDADPVRLRPARHADAPEPATVRGNFGGLMNEQWGDAHD